MGIGNLIHELLLAANDFTTLLFDLLDRLSSQQQHLAAMLLWSLWKSRNTKLWETMDTSSTFILSRAKDTLQEWSCMECAKFQRFNTEQSTSWVKPLMGRIKCNVDAALFNNNTMMGYGMCFRDFFGQLLYGKYGYLLSSANVLKAKTIALLESINVAISNGWNNVLFETDCKTLVEALASPIVPTNEFGDLVSCGRSLWLVIPTLQCHSLGGKLIKFLIVLLEHLYLTLAPIFSMMYHPLCTLCL